MKKIKTVFLLALISGLASVMVACSDDESPKKDKNKSSGDHVWKHQTDALKSAKEMSKKLQKSLDEQQQNLNESN